MKFLFSLLLCGLVSNLGFAAFEALPKVPPVPKNNPMSDAKVSLGRQLYFDARLSADGTVSCNTCHNVSTSGPGAGSGTDGLATSKGIKGQFGDRNPPTVWNAAYLSVQFWDGRAPSLEEQAKGPLINPVEMGNPDHSAVVKRVSKIPGYVKQFKAVFGKDEVTIDRIAQAIAAYERTLITPNSPYDRYLAGDKKAMSVEAQKGMKLFESVGCVSCHMGPAFAGPTLPEGTGFYQKFPTYAGTEYDKKYGFTKDQGRFAETKNESERHFFRVPTLRNVAVTSPYFHNGKVKALDEAVRVMAKTQLNKDLKPAEVSALVAFLKSLSGTRPIEKKIPALPQDG